MSESKAQLAKKTAEELKPKEWVTTVEVQQQLINFFVWAYAFSLLATFTMLFFQGFHLSGFALDPGLLKVLEIATIGEIGTLLVMIVRAAFR